MFFFLPEMWDSLRPKYPKKYKNTNIWPQKNKRNVTGSAAASRTRVQNFRVYLSQSAWTLDTEWNWGDKLEAACSCVLLLCIPPWTEWQGPFGAHISYVETVLIFSSTVLVESFVNVHIADGGKSRLYAENIQIWRDTARACELFAFVFTVYSSNLARNNTRTER